MADVGEDYKILICCCPFTPSIPTLGGCPGALDYYLDGMKKWHTTLLLNMYFNVINYLICFFYGA